MKQALLKYKLELLAGFFCLISLLYLTGLPSSIFFSKEPGIYTHGPVAQTEQPRFLFVLFHGASGKGEAILSIGKYYARSFPHAVFVAPEGPKAGLHIPYSHSWYYRWLEKTEELEEKVAATMPDVRHHIESAMTRYNVPPERTILFGFSQGAVVALYSALHMDKEFAAIIGVAGYLAGLDVPDNPRLKNTPIFLMQGSDDMTTPVAEHFRALHKLQQRGYKATGQVLYGIGHSVHSEFLEKSLPFLKMVLQNQNDAKE